MTPLNGIKATIFHDEGAVARCGYCGRYSLDPRTLGDRQPACECGEKHGWSGSFVKPGSGAEWSGAAPSATCPDLRELLLEVVGDTQYPDRQIRASQLLALPGLFPRPTSVLLDRFERAVRSGELDDQYVESRAAVLAARPLASVTASAQPKLGAPTPDIPLGCEMAHGWCVQVSVFGETLLTIEENALSGLSDLDPWAGTIRGCAQHLAAFIGEKTP